MGSLVSFYNPNDHTIVHGEIGPFIERLVENDKLRRGKLFVARYNKIGNFCICEWIGKPFDVFVDVMNLGKSLGNFNRTKATELYHRLFKPVTKDDMSQFLADNESDYLHHMANEAGEDSELCIRQEMGE